MMDEISKAASVMGKKGGAKTALLGHSFFSEIGKRGGKRRWEKERQSKSQQNVVDVNKDQVVSPNS